jgi:hypothetical protein
MSTRMSARERAASNGERHPWSDAPTGELGDQLLPRWFVLTAITLVVLGIVVLVAALFQPRRDAAPVEARRPPPSLTYTTAVGEVQTGVTEPEPYDAPCALLQGVRVAGSPTDRATLRAGLAGLCNIALPDDTAADVHTFAEQDGVVRFATFEATGVDSTASREAPATVFINARFQRTDPLWIAPLVAHDVTLRPAGRASAEGAVMARRAELAVCERLLGTRQRSRGCADAGAIVALDDPVAALRAVGFE